MFQKIMTPVDLSHLNDLQKSLDCGAALAKLYDASVVYVGVTGSAPSELAHDPKEFSEKLKAFAANQATDLGISADSKVQHCNDLTTDVDDALLTAIEETGADLVIMQSHAPDLREYIWPSNGGKVARHSKVSVMIVRD